MPTYVTGTETMIAKMLAEKSRIHANLMVAVEATCVDAANDSKDNHIPDEGHGMGRYENQTTMLTRSIASKIDRITPKSVDGIVYATMRYAPYVEERFPFIMPALIAVTGIFKRRLNKVLKEY